MNHDSSENTPASGEVASQCLSKALSRASFWPMNHIAPESAWLEHGPFAFWLIDALRPRVVVELGTHAGFSYFAFCQAVQRLEIDTRCYAVDTWKGDEHSGEYSDAVYELVKTYNDKNYSVFSDLVRSTFDEACLHFSDGTIDLLHIDGRHFIEDVKHDFETWKPKLSDRAVVVFHDTNVRERSFGVYKLWETLRTSYPSFEFFHGHGLGVLGIGKELPTAIRAMFELMGSEAGTVRESYARLGAVVKAEAIAHLKQEALDVKITELNQHSQHIRDLESEIRDKHDLNGSLKHENESLKRANDSLKHENESSKLENDSLQHENEGLKRENESSKRENDRLKHENESLQHEIGGLIHKNDGLKNGVVELESKSVGISQSVNELQNQISQKTQEILAYKHSTSWKMTSPYRFLGNRMRNILRKLFFLSKTIQRSGGVKPSMGHALKIIQQEGVHGLAHRIKAADSTNPKGIVSGNDYSEWLDRYAMLDGLAAEEVHAHLERSKKTPLISIVMPVYNPNLEWLEEAIQSVRNQLYPHWQLCIADDKSADPNVRQALLNYQALDERIKVTFRAANGHISAASNSALELATGEWIALMDQDDLLALEALYRVFEAIECNPDAALIYSDEDKIDEAGNRFSPYFKSDWNPDLFLSHNMISHLGVYKSDLVKSLGGFREGREGSQDYDLALRCIEVLKADQILHIPRVLYHWRSHADSTAQSGSNKGYALRVGQQVLNEHFQRVGIKATSELLDFGMYRTRYDLPDALPLVSLIIPTRNGLNLLRQCIDSIVAKTEYTNYEIIVIDNNSDDEDTLKYLDEISREKKIRVIRDTRPFNYSALNNSAVAEARGEFIGLINNDIEVISVNWLSEMVSIASQPGVGAVGARLWYPDDTLQHAGVILGLLGAAGHAHKGLPRGAPGYFGRAQLTQTLSAVTAACLIVRKDIFEQVGGLDEENLKVAFNDVDFCIRVREAGYRNVWTPYAELYHHESASRGLEDTPEKQARFLGEVKFLKERWGKVLQEDPAYSPNLTLDRDDYSLSWPPRIKTRAAVRE